MRITCLIILDLSRTKYKAHMKPTKSVRNYRMENRHPALIHLLKIMLQI